VQQQKQSAGCSTGSARYLSYGVHDNSKGSWLQQRQYMVIEQRFREKRTALVTADMWGFKIAL
jgi:hypothetical protein